jgi:hypothetical protein
MIKVDEMGLFSWTDPEEKTPKELLNLKDEMDKHKEYVVNHMTTIEGILSKILKLYEIQNTDIIDLRRDLLSFAAGITDLHFELRSDDKTVFSPTKGLLTGNTRTYYAAVLSPLLKELDIGINTGIELSMLAAVPDDAELRYRLALHGKGVDFLIYEPADMSILAAVKLVDNNDDGITGKILADVNIKYIRVNRDDPAERIVEVMREQVRTAVNEVRSTKAQE